MSESATNIAENVFVEQAKMLKIQIPMAVFGGVFAAAMVSYGVYDALGKETTLLWFSAVFLINIYLLVLGFFWRKHADFPFARKWVVYYYLQTFLHGLNWGLLGPAVFETGNNEAFTLTLLVMVGLASGSIMGTGSFFSLFLLFVSLVMFPSAYVMWSAGANEQWYLLTIAAVIYVPILASAGFNYNRSLKSSFRLRFENSDLLENLTREKERTEHTLEKLEQEIEQRKLAEQRTTQAMQQAESANFAKSRFIANMSHEIRTPLTSIMGFADALQDEHLSTEDRQRSVATIVRNGKHLLEIINDILDLSKIEADKLEVEKISVDLARLLDDVQATFTPLINDKGLEFKCEFRFPLPQVFVSDPTRIRQVLFNLLGNALKFTKSGSISLIVEYNPERQHVMLSVKDSGIGMSPKEMNKLFQPFSQADISTTRKFGGTGLGLTISKRLANLLGGDLTASSISGHGSVFTFTIACENVGALLDEFKLSADEHNHTEQTQHVSGHILLAEDNPDIQVLVRRFLESTGATVSVVDNGQKALNAIEKQSFDLIFMDMQMPVMDGETALRNLRARGCRIPVFALTANAMEEDRERYRLAGADGFLAKPIERDRIRQVLGQYLRAGEADADSDDEDEEFLRDLFDKFANSLPETLANILHMFVEQEKDALLKAVHDLKGTGGAFGHPKVTQLSAELECYLKEDDRDQAQYVLQQLQDYSNKLRKSA